MTRRGPLSERGRESPRSLRLLSPSLLLIRFEIPNVGVCLAAPPLTSPRSTVGVGRGTQEGGVVGSDREAAEVIAASRSGRCGAG